MDTKLILLLFFTLHVVGCLEINHENETDLPRKSYKEVEKEITDFINDQLRSLLPKIVGGAGSSTLSQKCMASMMKIFGNIRRLKGWTLKFLDSIGKPTAGIMKGTTYSLGHYDQCVDLAVTSKGIETQNTSEAMFQGMYCKIRIGFDDIVTETARKYHQGQINHTELGKLKEFIQATPYIPMTSQYMSHFLGICLPSTCTLDDVQELLGIISFPGSATVDRCEIKADENLNYTQMIVFILFLFLVGLVFVSTFIHWLCHRTIEDKLTANEKTKCISLTISFSLCNNTKRLTKNIEDDSDGVLSRHCVRGIVVASVAWIILGHTYLMPYDAFYMQSSSLENLRDYLTEQYFSFIVNFPLALDALFLCYGFILTYSLWYSACRVEDIKVNVIRLIACNYLRICIPVLLCLGIVELLPVLGSGPFWKDFIDDAVTKSSKNAGAYIGMYSNFLDQDEQSLPHLWFTSCFAQVTLAGIILSWILAKNTKFGIVALVLLVLAGNITVGIYTFNNEFPPSFIAYFAESSSTLFWKLNYSLPMSHFGPYALGMLTGIFVARRSSHRLRPFLVIVGWLVCLAILEGLFLFVYQHHTEQMSPFWSAVYAGSHRTLFALSISWVIVACSFGSGGFVNAVLSSRIFDPLFRLSYYAYILHFVVIAFTVGVAREHFHYSHQELIFRAISCIVVTYFLSYLLYMLLEMPLKSLCCALCPKRSSKIDVTPLNNFRLDKVDFLTANNTITGSCKLWSVSNNKSVAY